MGKTNLRKHEKIPYCPDPEKYILVRSKEGIFWRRKRGSVKKAVLNDAFKANARLLKQSGPVAVAIVQQLKPYLKGLQPGRLTLRISNGLRKALKEKNQIDYCYLQGMNIQPDYTLEQLLMVPYRVDSNKKNFRITIPIGEGNVKRHNQLVSHYYFEALLLYGEDAKDLQTEALESKLYAFDEIGPNLVLTLPLPAAHAPWMALLKVSCLEGKELASHWKNYGMKVVGNNRQFEN